MLHITGIAASAGLVIGKAKRIKRASGGLTRVVLDSVREKALFEAAVLLAKDELSELEERASAQDKDIFLFQRVMLDDKGLREEINQAIAAGMGGAAAVEQAAEVYMQRIRSIDNEYLRERAADVQDACMRIVSILDGRPRDVLLLKEPAIIAADEIYPSDIVSVDKGMILGIITAAGSVQGHAAIISRTMGIPAIVQAGDAFLEQCDGQSVALDGFAGEAFFCPDEPTRARFLHRIAQLERHEKKLQKLKNAPCITPDGQTVQLMANCSCPEDIEQAIDKGADGVGLLRSEFMLMNGKIPSEQQQYQFYVRCLKAAEGKPVTVRTFDVGADKEVDGISHKEDNPALGLRGIRLCLSRRDLLEPQLSALLRAALYGPLKIMFPMIANEQEFSAALDVVEDVKRNLSESGIAFAQNVPIGTMIETPAAALLADRIAPLCDFFSIGTNDLTQYTLAIDRGHPSLAARADHLNPAVLHLIAATCRAGKKYNKPVAVCGAMAGDSQAVPLLIGLGVTELAVSAQAIGKIKAIVRTLDENFCAQAAQQAMALKNAKQVRAFVHKTFDI